MRTDDDAALLAALSDGDEAAYLKVVERYQPTLLRLAKLFVAASAVEDVVQDTWLGMLRGLDSFQGRASFKTWLFRILINRARTRAVRDGRTLPLSAVVQQETCSLELAVDPSRFQGAAGRYPGHWLVKPSPDEIPEDQLLAGELNERLRAALAHLPAVQSEVVRLRDIEGLSAEEVCQMLNLTEGNQRVLLHRGRSKIRAALAEYVAVEVS